MVFETNNVMEMFCVPKLELINLKKNLILDKNLVNKCFWENLISKTFNFLVVFLESWK